MVDGDLIIKGLTDQCCNTPIITLSSGRCVQPGVYSLGVGPKGPTLARFSRHKKREKQYQGGQTKPSTLTLANSHNTSNHSS